MWYDTVPLCSLVQSQHDRENPEQMEYFSIIYDHCIHSARRRYCQTNTQKNSNQSKKCVQKHEMYRKSIEITPMSYFKWNQSNFLGKVKRNEKTFRDGFVLLIQRERVCFQREVKENASRDPHNPPYRKHRDDVISPRLC